MIRFSQNKYKCRLDWGYKGTKDAALRNDIIIIVDTMSFSSCIVTAVNNGGIIYPCSKDENPKNMSKKFNAEIAIHRNDFPEKGNFSLSPVTFKKIEKNTKVILQSPNGATCTKIGKESVYLFAGTFLNSYYLAQVIENLMKKTNLNLTIISCGERFREENEDGYLRFALEDYLACGSILSNIKSFSKSPEALVCENSFISSKDSLKDVLWNCDSGLELREKGFEKDVEHISQLNIYNSIPIYKNNSYSKFQY